MLPKHSQPSWHFSVEEFAARHVPESHFPVYRAPSTYPNVGFGMFASRFLGNGEVVAEYTGTMKRFMSDRTAEGTAATSVGFHLSSHFQPNNPLLTSNDGMIGN